MVADIGVWVFFGVRLNWLCLWFVVPYLLIWLSSNKIYTFAGWPSLETSNNSSPNLIIYLCKIEWVEFKDIFIWDVCRYLGFFSASIFHFYLYFSHLKRFFLDAAARMPTKVENHIPGLSPGNFLCKLLEISSEISCQCNARQE